MLGRKRVHVLKLSEALADSDTAPVPSPSELLDGLWRTDVTMDDTAPNVWTETEHYNEAERLLSNPLRGLYYNEAEMRRAEHQADSQHQAAAAARSEAPETAPEVAMADAAPDAEVRTMSSFDRLAALDPRTATSPRSFELLTRVDPRTVASPRCAPRARWSNNFVYIACSGCDDLIAIHTLSGAGLNLLEFKRLIAAVDEAQGWRHTGAAVLRLFCETAVPFSIDVPDSKLDLTTLARSSPVGPSASGHIGPEELQKLLEQLHADSQHMPSSAPAPASGPDFSSLRSVGSFKQRAGSSILRHSSTPAMRSRSAHFGEQLVSSSDSRETTSPPLMRSIGSGSPPESPPSPATASKPVGRRRRHSASGKLPGGRKGADSSPSARRRSAPNR